ncbi:M56 family metallopeptidase [Kordia sp.]|uniref:M56 family metallopeptidase n=1 Tax=Kordia sp. TaxID=1965332 RepID=UPI003D6A630B
MIAYLLKSGLCLALILLVYKVFLARERMYVFNRYYLLFGLCFSLLVPFVTMETIVEAPIVENLNSGNTTDHLPAFDAALPMESSPSGIPAWMYVTISMYILGYLLFFFRFTRNIYRIFYKIIKSVRVRYKTASLVLLKENILPHTFLHYIFLEKDAYDTHDIAEELYTHELAHVTQKHSLDIILIELIQIVFWFNPLLIYYKKAMQLNHEFLADDAVLKSNTQIPAYQHLLLENAHWNNNLHLASNLNFSVTKKRLQMMTKHTTRVRVWIIATLTIPIFIGALFLFSTKVVAQETKTNKVSKTQTVLKEVPKQNTKADYYKNATIYISTKNGKSISKKYDELTPEQQDALLPVPKIPTATRPTNTLLNNWKDSSKYAIWIDGKHVPNTAIAGKEIVHYTESFVHKNARSNSFPQSYQMSLYTQEGFNSYRNNIGKELPKGSKLRIKTAHKKGKKVTYEKDIPRTIIKVKDINRLHDIIIRFDKKHRISVNEVVIKSINGLSPRIKAILSSMKNKKSPVTAAIVYDTNDDKAKDLIAKIKLILERNNITEIRTIFSYGLEIPPPPPPPPAPPVKKPMLKEISGDDASGPNVSEQDAKYINIMHKIIKGKKLETMMINGKKHYYVLKNGRKYIFNEDSRLVNEKGELLPPPPPRAKKPQVKEIKVKNKNKNKAKKKAKAKNKAKDTKKVVPKVIEVKEVPKKKLKEKQL